MKIHLYSQEKVEFYEKSKNCMKMWKFKWEYKKTTEIISLREILKASYQIFCELYEHVIYLAVSKKTVTVSFLRHTNHKILTNNPKTLQKYKDKKKEYYENNKEILLKKQKKYNETNRDIRILKQREYHENNKDKAKEYYEKNKDIISEKKKIIYEQNKEKYNEPIICECEYCNCLTSLNNIKRHQKTKKCKKYQ